MNTPSEVTAFESHVRALVDLGALLQDVADEDQVYALLAHGLRQVIGDDAIVNVSAYDNRRGSYGPKVLLGLGHYIDKLMALLGKRPEELTGDYTELVKQAMATGRLTRVEGGVVELARNSLPAAVINAAVALIGIADVYVIGFKKGVCVGGISILTRRPGLALPAVIIEAMTALGAVAIVRVRGEKLLRENDERLKKQNNVLLTLMSQGTLFQKDLQQAVAEITEVSASLLETERVSVWLYSDDYAVIRCLDLYLRSKHLHSSGEELPSLAFPAYAESHRRGAVIAAMDVFTDPRTCDIPAAYYRSHGISSLLDAPVWIHGRMGGILSFEQTGEERSWTVEDERLANNMAALLSLCFENSERREAEEALRKSEAALKQQNEVFSVLLNNLSSGVFMVEAPSGRPLIANPAAQRLLGRGILPDASSENLAQVYRAHKAGTSAPYPLEEMPIVRGMWGETAHIDDMVVERPDGEKTRLEVFGAPIRNADGQVWASLVSFQDVTERKRAEEELRSNFTLLQIAGETAHFGGWSVDLRSSTCTWSDAVADIHEVPRGYAPPLEKGIEFYAPQWHDRIVQVFTACAEDGIPYDEDMEIITRKGKRVWVRTIGRAVKNEDGRIVQVQGSFQDITERKQAEEALQKRLVALTQPLDSSAGISFADMFNLADIQRLQDDFARATGVASIITHPDGTPITAPSRFCHLCINLIRKTEKGLANCMKSDASLGRPSHDGPTIQPCLSGGLWDAGAAISVGGRHVANWLIGQVRDAAQTEEKIRAYAREIGADENAMTEAFQAVPAMSRAHFEEVAGMLYTLATQLSATAYQNLQQARFITERKQAEEKLRESEAKLSALFASMTEMVVLHEVVFDETEKTPVNYRITDCNAAFTRITGIRREDAVGKLATEVYGTPVPPYLNEFVRVGITGEPYHYETRYAPMDKHFSISVVSPGRNRFATITTDITETKRIQAVIDAKNKELEQLIYVASHDLRSPLVNVDGFSRELNFSLRKLAVLLDSGKDKEELAQALRMEFCDMEKSVGRIRASTGQMDKLLKGLLHLSRQGRAALQIDDVDMNACISQLSSSFAFTMKEQRVELIAGNLPACRADAVQVTQVFANLIDNAIKYRDPARPLKIQITGALEADRAVYRVKDNGVGIAENHIAHVFELFHRLEPEKIEGDGLGLTIVRQALSRMYGEIRVESEIGRGSVFIVSMPQAPKRNNSRE